MRIQEIKQQEWCGMTQTSTMFSFLLNREGLVALTSMAGMLYGCDYMTSAVAPSLAMFEVPTQVVTMGLCWLTVTASLFSLVKTAFITPTMFLPAILVAKVTECDKLREDFIEKEPTAATVYVTTPDGVTLDAIEITQPHAERWAIWLNANGVPYEHNLNSLSVYSKALNVNVISCNYRGVGRSTSWPLGFYHLVEDGAAVIEHLLKNGVDEDKIHLHGHSLGGGTLVTLHRMYPQIKVIQDRSFRSMKAAAAVVAPLMKNPLSYALAFVMTFGLYLTLRFSPYAEQATFLRFVVATLALGYALCQTTLASEIAPKAIAHYGWDIDAVSGWNVKRGLVLYHPNDEMLPPHLSGSYPVLEEEHGDTLNSIKLSHRGEGMACHMYPLHTQGEEWARVVGAIRRLMHEDS
eukprot:m.357474 g.357474  ORF g.357474 m.357474 type:complete len:407 (-) comp17855_c0_seq1:293-1513(-)